MNTKLGIIFDWDGVIIDSSAQHEQSWERLALEQGKELPVGHFLKGFGMKNEWIIPEILGWTHDSSAINDLSLRKEYLYRVILKENGVTPIKGVKDFLKQLNDSGVPCAIGSSTHKENISTALNLLGFTEFFREVVSSEDVDQGKPNPQVFLKAAEKLDLPPGNCIVIEDAVVGIEAARAGRIKVIAVTNTRSPSELEGADKIVNRLDEINLADLQELIRQ